MNAISFNEACEITGNYIVVGKKENGEIIKSPVSLSYVAACLLSVEFSFQFPSATFSVEKE